LGIIIFGGPFTVAKSKNAYCGKQPNFRKKEGGVRLNSMVGVSGPLGVFFDYFLI